MAPHELKLRAPVSKDLRDLPKSDVLRILGQIELFRDEPRPIACVRLASQERYRIRQGN